MAKKQVLEAQNPLILRCHRLMDAFAKSDDERDFYIDRLEGFLIYVDLDKPQNEMDALTEEIKLHADRYCLIPKLSFYETKKIMEGFVNEKVYDIDTKEKLLDIIQSKEARENFLEFIFDHHSELEKWQLFYQERSRIRIIEWLRANHFHFVFEEDLELPRQMSEKLKQSLFEPKVGKDVLAARKMLSTKAKTYYSNEALNPRPKRGRPPKQAVKPDIEPQVTVDIYTTVPQSVRPFLYIPDINLSSTFSAFSSKFGTDEELQKRNALPTTIDGSIAQKLASIRSLSSKWVEKDGTSEKQVYQMDNSFDDDEEDDDDDDFDDVKPLSKVKKVAKPSKPVKAAKSSVSKKSPPVKKPVKKVPVKAKVPSSPKNAKKRIMPTAKTALKGSGKPKPIIKTKVKAKAKPAKAAPLKKLRLTKKR